MKNKFKGMTLIELTVSCMVIVMLTVIAGYMISQAHNIFRRGSRDTDDLERSRKALLILNENLANADDIYEIYNTTTGDNLLVTGRNAYINNKIETHVKCFKKVENDKGLYDLYTIEYQSNLKRTPIPGSKDLLATNFRNVTLTPVVDNGKVFNDLYNIEFIVPSENWKQFELGGTSAEKQADLVIVNRVYLKRIPENSFY